MSFKHFESVPEGYMSVGGICNKSTEKAFLVQVDTVSLGSDGPGEPTVYDISLEERKFWIPKSQIAEFDQDKDGNIILLVKTWVMEKNNVFIPF